MCAKSNSQNAPFFAAVTELGEESRLARSVTVGGIEQVIDNLRFLHDGQLGIWQLHGATLSRLSSWPVMECIEWFWLLRFLVRAPKWW
jgi:hypothetical protein